MKKKLKWPLILTIFQLKLNQDHQFPTLLEVMLEIDGGDDIDDEYISPSTATQTGESTSTMASNSIEDDDLPF